MSNRAQEIQKLTETAKSEHKKLNDDVEELEKHQMDWREKNDRS